MRKNRNPLKEYGNIEFEEDKVKETRGIRGDIFKSISLPPEFVNELKELSDKH